MNGSIKIVISELTFSKILHLFFYLILKKNGEVLFWDDTNYQGYKDSSVSTLSLGRLR